tara:strand:- start:6738 stop:7139 length:402 start_codon:yes stop_codon:yes gene_type:complete
MERDIENNLGEQIIPEFNMYTIITVDENYKQIYKQITEIQCDNNDLNFMTNVLSVNELYIEHVSNIEKLLTLSTKYNSINTYNGFTSSNKKINLHMDVRSKKIQIYFEEILPILQESEYNLSILQDYAENMYR